MSNASLSTVLLTDPDSAELHALLNEVVPDLPIRTLDQMGTESECQVWLGATEGVVELLGRGLQPRWVQLTCADVSSMIEPHIPRDYLLTRACNVFGASMLEYVVHQLLAHAWQATEYPLAQSRFNWRPAVSGRLSGKRALITGLGSIGLHIAAGLASLGMVVCGIQRNPRPLPNVSETGRLVDLLRLAANADYVINVLPDTPHTKDLFDSEFFAALPRHALFINVGRGSAVDDQALVKALNEGQLAGAVLDVFRKEPLPPSHQFWVTPNLHLTPHVAGPLDATAMIDFFLSNLRKYQAGQPLEGQVRFERGY
ncbi:MULTISPECIES: D-2-hydroxyacid dehydrogenase [Pseudomonas]|uniref:D-2-hydroxyacid dehydrogenase n=1 Tax=Pseudomonas TaxID=286 RepID=UPI0009F63013|nr:MULTISPECIES: D-2-hydroxyacid dehydrogenase [Pseudomonas]MDG9889975.1 D-2-hydroxyacid dehydrogenase [Pseudomonas juntendi]QOH70637.1 D-2-hydroxyacid dehydrogenase [Pseudomonas putida]RFQ03444.1 D-2-hydroxyacid dehydrogenase [Pseudomonas putida]